MSTKNTLSLASKGITLALAEVGADVAITARTAAKFRRWDAAPCLK